MSKNFGLILIVSVFAVFCTILIQLSRIQVFYAALNVSNIFAHWKQHFIRAGFLYCQLCLSHFRFSHKQIFLFFQKTAKVVNKVKIKFKQVFSIFDIPSSINECTIYSVIHKLFYENKYFFKKFIEVIGIEMILKSDLILFRITESKIKIQRFLID
jgi:hypothetical protein